MRTAIVRSVFAACAASIVLAAAPLAAQDLATNAVRPAPMPVATREVAKYRFAAGRAEGLPAEITLVDRGGELTATYRLPGQRAAQPMEVTVLDMDLVLQAETDKGVLTVQLYGQNDASAKRPVTGRWILGGRSGELRGKAQ